MGAFAWTNELHYPNQSRTRCWKTSTLHTQEKLSSCSDEHFISPIVITVKKDQSIKLALDSKVLNKAIHKNKYQMPNIEMLIDTISQHHTDTQNGQ